MKAIMRWGSGLAALLLFTSVSFGQTYWATPVLKTPIPVAPDACGPGFYTMDCYGQVYGPHYCLRPPFPPFQGLLPGPTGQHLMAAQQGIPPWAMPPRGPYGAPGQFPNPGQPTTGVYPTHPYVRGPRDFFMWNEEMEDSKGRDTRPKLVP